VIGLNVGSGEHPCPGDWVNLDLRWHGVKVGPRMVYADAFVLPFGPETFDRLYLGHLMEHLWWQDIAAGKCDEFWRVAKPGAEVVVVGPCLHKALELNEPKFILEAIVGGGDSGWLIEGPGSHKWIPTEALTAKAMMLAGLVEVEPIDVGTIHFPQWPNAAPQARWQACLRARVP
jgi:predicted SAM-dependent methyltransferase